MFESYSAGTHKKDKINPDAVRIMLEKYGIDMEQTQHPKLLDDIPPVDIVITMGCNVECPFLPCKHREDWGIDDPTGKSDEEFLKTIAIIETNIQNLRSKILDNTEMMPEKDCPGVQACTCPKKHCPNNAKCCACISFHRQQGESDYLPYCLFPHSDKSMENVCRKLNERFDR
jgi:arsenate reductase